MRLDAILVMHQMLIFAKIYDPNKKMPPFFPV